jgi:hypothetical protein
VIPLSGAHCSKIVTDLKNYEARYLKYTIWIYFIAIVFGREDTEEDQPLNSDLEKRDCTGELKYYMKEL